MVDIQCYLTTHLQRLPDGFHTVDGPLTPTKIYQKWAKIRVLNANLEKFAKKVLNADENSENHNMYAV